MREDEDDDVERSESGAPIYRHQPRRRPIDPAFGDEETIEAVTDHIEEFVGEPENVFHELISDLVHVDVHVVEPRKKRDYYTLVTSGMSDRPMKAPEDHPDKKYAELLICLPPDWKMSEKALEKDRWSWPIHWLKLLARLPHQYDTWLWEHHTVPNGDPPEPFADNTDLCCAYLLRPALFPKEFFKLKLGNKKTVHFFCLVPLYEDEMKFKLKVGSDDLVDRLDEAGVT
ncbi:MAG: suppressor of fused domain protein, partial [Zavarzinella sp.]|nr:suppressor of fused domain protein [Zavarzinella sp.]